LQLLICVYKSVGRTRRSIWGKRQDKTAALYIYAYVLWSTTTTPC